MRQFALAAPLAFAGWTMWRSGGGPRQGRPRPGRVSRVETGWLDMTLDHDSGAMDGRVLRGRFEDAWLSDLPIGDLRALRDEIDAAADAESLSLLDAYAERERAGAPGGGEAGQAAAPGRDLSAEEAYRILGLEPGASVEEVRAAYHRLIRKVHPDSGGLSALAAMINAARERLDPG